jgi:nitrite reductase/ring-hydroxylating ferredoxin subunit
MTEVIRLEGAALPEEGHAVRVVANGNPVAVFRVGGSLYALDARCTHVGGPLEKGTLEGTHVTCPWHHSVFDIRDGTVVHGPATRPVSAYRARLEGQTLVLEKD